MGDRADRAAPGEHVRRAVEHLKELLARSGAPRRDVLDGGTLNEQNVDELAQLEMLDGMGATRGSLELQAFVAIVDRTSGAGRAD